MPNVRRLAVVTLTVLMGCSGELTPPVDPTPVVTGNWRLKSFDDKQVPATYVEFFDEPVDDRIVEHVIIRLDSAKKVMRADSTYVRSYYFTEIQDGVELYKYSWGDHGRYTVARATPAAITLTSEYIENLSAAGHVSPAGDLQLSEPLWISEDPRNTVWTKR